MKGSLEIGSRIRATERAIRYGAVATVAAPAAAFAGGGMDMGNFPVVNDFVITGVRWVLHALGVL